MGIYFIYGKITKLNRNDFVVEEAYWKNDHGIVMYQFYNRYLNRKKDTFRFINKEKRKRTKLLWLNFWVVSYSHNYKKAWITKHQYLSNIEMLCRYIRENTYIGWNV